MIYWQHFREKKHNSFIGLTLTLIYLTWPENKKYWVDQIAIYFDSKMSNYDVIFADDIHT